MTLKTRTPARLIAAKTLSHIIRDQHSLTHCGAAFAAHNERAFIHALCLGALRCYPQLEAIAARLLKKPLKAKDRDCYSLLLIGLYECWQQQTPDYAMVDAQVNAAKCLPQPWAPGLINRLCRDFIRTRETLLGDIHALSAYPAWWRTHWQRDWPEDAATIEAALALPAPLSVRVNTMKTTRQALLEQWRTANVNAQTHPNAPDTLVLATPLDVTTLPGFAEGLFYVQDCTASLAAPLLAVQPGERVLDACAAPGGKTTHLYAQQPTLGALISIDNNATRMQTLTENCARLDVPAQAITADGADLGAWWDGNGFDKVLLDAPCSGSGVIRRHPDILYCRTADMITALVHTQQQLLAKLARTLAPGGQLLYVTCSVLAQENDAVIERFCQTPSEGEAKVERRLSPQPITLAWGRATRYGWQCLPGEQGGDGFYFCLLA